MFGREIDAAAVVSAAADDTMAMIVATGQDDMTTTYPDVHSTYAVFVTDALTSEPHAIVMVAVGQSAPCGHDGCPPWVEMRSAGNGRFAEAEAEQLANVMGHAVANGDAADMPVHLDSPNTVAGMICDIRRMH